MKTIRPDIFETLQSQILEGLIQPGDRLKEAELAERFGISRTPVREALRRLETRGLLTHEPHRGMVVAQLDQSAVAELYAMRELLDGAAAEFAAQHASETEISAMESQIARDRTLLDAPQSETPQRLASSNRAFHAAIIRAAHNRFLMKASDALAEALALLGPTTLAIEGRGARSVEEHAAIVTAIKARDRQAAGEAARHHIRAAFKARLMLLDHAIVEAPEQPK